MPTVRSTPGSILHTNMVVGDVYTINIGDVVMVSRAEYALTALSLMEAGHGAAILPEEAVQVPHESVVFRPIKSSASCKTSLMWRRNEVGSSVVEFVENLRSSILSNTSPKHIARPRNCNEKS